MEQPITPTSLMGKKKAIIETSKEPFRDTYLDKIRQVTNFEDIDYIVLNHTEPDHSGNLTHLLDYAKMPL